MYVKNVTLYANVDFRKIKQKYQLGEYNLKMYFIIPMTLDYEYYHRIQVNLKKTSHNIFEINCQNRFRSVFLESKKNNLFF